jgi:small subunit ribosomal protein S6
MNKYEMMIIVDATLTEDELVVEMDKFKKLMEDQSCEAIEVSKWGKRKLAYEINKKHNEGYYVLANYSASKEAVLEIDRKMKLDEKVIRHMNIRKDPK